MSPSTLHHAPASAHQRIARLATLTAVHRAFHWLHLHQPQLRAVADGDACHPRTAVRRRSARGVVPRALCGPWTGECASGWRGQRARRADAASSPMFPASCFPRISIPSSPRLLPAFRRKMGLAFSARVPATTPPGLTALLGIAAALRFAGVAPPISDPVRGKCGRRRRGRPARHAPHLPARSLSRPHCGAIALEGSGSSAVVTRAL